MNGVYSHLGGRSGHQPKLSIVIASRDREDLLHACLDSIKRCADTDYEIIVVDSASRDADRIARVAHNAGAVLLRTEVPGAARARNIGAKAANGNIIAFIDDDAIAHADWAATLCRAFEDPSVAAVVGPVFELGTYPLAVMPTGAGFIPDVERPRFCRTMPNWFDRVAFGAIGFGTNLGVRKSAFESHGMFRESLGAGAPISGDESYFLLTMVARGGLVVNEPDARVSHPPQTEGRLREIRITIIAYLAYVILTQPRLTALIVKRLLRRLVRKNSDGGPSKSPRESWSLAALVPAMLAAPCLLVAAWLIERRKSGASSQADPF